MNKVDNFVAEMLAFMADLHSCFSPMCKYVVSQINGKGKQRSYCSKYGQIIKRVHNHCIDHFSGFTVADVNEIKRQYKAGRCELVINGVAV